jgi:hypothetical protein
VSQLSWFLLAPGSGSGTGTGVSCSSGEPQRTSPTIEEKSNCVVEGLPVFTNLVCLEKRKKKLLSFLFFVKIATNIVVAYWSTTVFDYRHTCIVGKKRSSLS